MIGRLCVLSLVLTQDTTIQLGFESINHQISGLSLIFFKFEPLGMIRSNCCLCTTFSYNRDADIFG